MGFKVAVVGATGNVGREMLEILAERAFPADEVVPLASRTLMGTPKVTMTSMGQATVEFRWAWDPTKMGELFDASGKQVQTFNTWDRGTLIDKYNVKFYRGAPTKAVLTFVRNGRGWEPVQP